MASFVIGTVCDWVSSEILLAVGSPLTQRDLGHSESLQEPWFLIPSPRQVAPLGKLKPFLSSVLSCFCTHSPLCQCVCLYLNLKVKILRGIGQISLRIYSTGMLVLFGFKWIKFNPGREFLLFAKTLAMNANHSPIIVFALQGQK